MRWYKEKAHDVFPMISRTSSQSSGFESMKNCNNSTPPPQNYDDNNEFDRFSLFSDRPSITRSRIDSTIMTNNQKVTAGNVCASIEENNLLKNQLRFPVLDKKQYVQSHNATMAARPVNRVNSFDTAML